MPVSLTTWPQVSSPQSSHSQEGSPSQSRGASQALRSAVPSPTASHGACCVCACSAPAMLPPCISGPPRLSGWASTRRQPGHVSTCSFRDPQRQGQEDHGGAQSHPPGPAHRALRPSVMCLACPSLPTSCCRPQRHTCFASHRRAGWRPRKAQCPCPRPPTPHPLKFMF